MAAPTNPPPAAPPAPVENASRKRRIAVVAAAYLIAVGVLFLIEHADELEHLPLGKSLKGRIEHFGTLYALQMKLVPRPLESHYVSLLDFGSPQGSCDTRRRVTTVLPRLVAARPAMIVSDITFIKANCSDEPHTTEMLVKALRAASETTPLVLAEAELSLDRMPYGQAEDLRAKGFGDNDLLALEPVPVDGVEFGSLVLNADRRKVPILWAVRPTAEASPLFHDSLSFAAAKLYRRNFPDRGKRLEDLAGAGYHPFTSLLREADFSTVAVNRISEKSEMDKLKGRIVIMGFSRDMNDFWSSYVGTLPGYVLHANYLEALLDARAYRPVSLFYQFLISAVWFGIVELPFWFHKFSSLGALMRSFALSLLIMFVLYYVLLVNFGWYVSVAPPSVLVIAGRVLYQALEQKAKKESEQHIPAAGH